MKKFFKFGLNNKKSTSSVNVRAGNDHRRNSSLSTSSSSAAFLHDAAADEYFVDPSSDKLFTKLHKASWSGDLEKVKKYVKKFDVNEVDSELRTPLHLAAAKSHKDVIWFLLGCKAQPNFCDSEGNTPLLKAVQCHHADIVHFLLDRGADPKASNKTGNTGLHIAAQFGLKDIGCALIRKGASVDVVNYDGYSPLLVATVNGRTEMIEMLLSNGASVNAADTNKRTGLMLACEVGSVEMVGLFLDHNADVDATSSLGLTAKDVARVSEHGSCLDLVEARHAKISPTLRGSELDNPTSPHVSFGPVNDLCLPPFDNAIISEKDHICPNNQKAGIDDAGLDSWNDDDDTSFEAQRQTVLKSGLDLSKFLEELSSSDKSHTVKDNSLSSTKGDKVATPLKVESKLEEQRSAFPQKSLLPEEYKIDSLVDMAEPQHIILPANVSSDFQIACSGVDGHKERMADEEDKLRVEKNRDLMAELGLSDVSGFSSPPSSSLKNEVHKESGGDDTDLEQDLLPVDNLEKTSAKHTGVVIEEIPDSVGLVENEDGSEEAALAGKSDSIDDDNYGNVVEEGPVEVDSGAQPMKGVTLEPKPSTGDVQNSEESDWDVSDDSLDGAIHIQPLGLKPKSPKVEESSPVKRRDSMYVVRVDLRVEQTPDHDVSAAAVEPRPQAEEVDSEGSKTDEDARGSCRDGTLGRSGTLHEVEEIWEKNASVKVPSSAFDGGQTFHADCVQVRESPEASPEPDDGDSAAWGRLWSLICNQPLVSNVESDSNDEVSTTLTANGSAKEEMTAGSSLSVQEFSSVDDPSSSLHEDHIHKLLAAFLRESAGSTRVFNLIQFLRHAWRKEQSRCKVLTDKIGLLKKQHKGSVEKLESSGSQCREFENRTAELETELDSLKRLLSVEMCQSKEVGLQLQQREQQLESLEAKYIEEVSSRQKSELRSRVLNLEAEQAQLLLARLEDEVRTKPRRSFSDVAIQAVAGDDNDSASLIDFLEAEARSYKEQLADLQSQLHSEFGRRSASETRLAHLEQTISDLEARASESEQNAKVCQTLVTNLSAENETLTASVKDLEAQRSDESARFTMMARDRREDETKLECALLKQEVSSLEETSKKLEAELKQTQLGKSDLEKEVDEAQKKLAEARSECVVLKAELERSCRSIDARRQETEADLQSKWKLMMDRAQEDFEAMRRITTDKNRILSDSVGQLRGELELAYKRVAELESQVVLARVESSREGVQSRCRAIEDLERRCVATKIENEELIRQVAVEKATREEQESQLSAFLGSIDILEKKLRAVEKKAADEYETLRHRYQSAVDGCDELRARLARSEEAVRTKESLMESMCHQLEDSASKISTLQRQLGDSDANVKNTENRIAELLDAFRNGKIQAEVRKGWNRGLGDDDTAESKESPWSNNFGRSTGTLEQRAKNYGKEDVCSTNDQENLEKCIGLLRISLEDDNARRKEVEARNRDLEKQLLEARAMLRYDRDLQTPQTELGRLSSRHLNCVDRDEIEVIRQQLETKARLELNQKLEQINDFLEEQTKSSSRLEKLHSQSDDQLRQECSMAIQALQKEVIDLQQHVHEKDSRNNALEEQYRQLCELLQAKRRIKEKLADSRDHGRKCGPQSRQERQPHVKPTAVDYLETPPPLNRMAYSTSVMPPPPFASIRNNLKVSDYQGPSYKLRAELDRVINKHLNSGAAVDDYGSSRFSRDAFDLEKTTSASDYLISLKRNYLL